MNTMMQAYRVHKGPRQGLPLGQLWLPLFTWYGAFKEVGDFLLAAFIAVFAVPILAAAALLVRLTSRGPAFYSQTRLGRYGKVYTIYKLRSMYHNCEAKSGVQWSTKGDPRITPIGKFLRKSHIDELPQLWNVLRGDMSLIGPRPERPEFVPQLESAIPAYRCRLLVKPGVTGLAQVLLPPDTDLSSVRRKVAHDLHYVRFHSPLLDLHILFATIFHVMGVPYLHMPKLVSLPGGHLVEHAYEESVTHSGQPAKPAKKPQIAKESEWQLAGVSG